MSQISATPDQVERLTKLMSTAQDPEWLEALVLCALDQTGGDLDAAIEAALKALQVSPTSDHALTNNTGHGIGSGIPGPVAKEFNHSSEMHNGTARIRPYSKDEMVDRGADGFLSKGYARYIPLHKVVGREPVPAASEGDAYTKGKAVKQPIEVAYDKSNDSYHLYGGNHRVHQSELNGEKHILAFVEPDGDREVGASATRSKPIIHNEGGGNPYHDAKGEFSSGPGGSAHEVDLTIPAKQRATKSNMVDARREGTGKEARVVLHNGDPAPEHIKPSMIPPNWTHVRIGTDPDADVLVQARDAAGRAKTVYADSFHLRNAAIKFARTQEGLRNSDEIAKQNQENRKNPDHKEAADCTWLMLEQGTRPGSDQDTKAKVKAFGATTLLGEHVVHAADGLRLQFVGKEGVYHDHLIRNPDLAKMLADRKATADQRGGKLFATNYDNVAAYAKSLDGGKFTPKDWRTTLANKLAVAEIAKQEGPPKNEKDYKQLVKAVGVSVSHVLGNKPAQALESYIDPVLFSGWRVHAGKEKEDNVGPVNNNFAILSTSLSQLIFNEGGGNPNHDEIGRFTSGPGAAASHLPIDKELEGAVTTKLNTGTIHEASLCKVTVGDKHYFFKGYDKSYDPDISGKNDLAVSHLSSICGLHTPACKEATVNGRKGVIHDWTKGRTMADVVDSEGFKVSKLQDMLGTKAIEKQVLFNYLCSANDRHVGNYMITPGNKIVSIDHEFSFGHLPMGPLGLHPLAEGASVVQNDEMTGLLPRNHKFDKESINHIASKIPDMIKALKDMGMEKEANDLGRRGKVVTDMVGSSTAGVDTIIKVGEKYGYPKY